MQPILKEISVLAIKLGDVPFSNEQIESQWLGTPPAALSQVEAVEKNLGVRLPEDYRNFLMITNGFAAINDSTEPRLEFLLLIPPKQGSELWKYWKFASWIPGEQEFENLHAYFLDVLDFLKENR